MKAWRDALPTRTRPPCAASGCTLAAAWFCNPRGRGLVFLCPAHARAHGWTLPCYPAPTED